MARKELTNVYLKPSQVKKIDEYIQANYMRLKAQGKANRSAVVREIVDEWAKKRKPS